jgi:hypothetical protein
MSSFLRGAVQKKQNRPCGGFVFYTESVNLKSNYLLITGLYHGWN